MLPNLIKIHIFCIIVQQKGDKHIQTLRNVVPMVVKRGFDITRSAQGEYYFSWHAIDARRLREEGTFRM